MKMKCMGKGSKPTDTKHGDIANNGSHNATVFPVSESGRMRTKSSVRFQHNKLESEQNQTTVLLLIKML
jgi:hypothetical protein